MPRSRSFRLVSSTICLLKLKMPTRMVLGTRRALWTIENVLPTPARDSTSPCSFPFSRKSQMASCCGEPRTRSDFVTFVESLRSEEHTSELQSRLHLVCRLLLEKKKKKKIKNKIMQLLST